MSEVVVRVYGPLNDFLPRERRQRAWVRRVDGQPSVKDLVESLGVPHPEIDLLIVNGESVGFDCPVRDGDRMAVYPRFEALDVAPLTRVRPPATPVIRFVADVHLGTLARHLRLAGFDTAYRSTADDAELAEVAEREDRVLLTRDVALLKRRSVLRGYFVRNTNPHRQFVEVVRRFGEAHAGRFSRCTTCNGLLRRVDTRDVADSLPPRTREHYDVFEQCARCGQLYWQGSHWRRLTAALDALLAEAGTGTSETTRHE